MCGLLFIHQNKKFVSREKFLLSLSEQSWRGPDNTSYFFLKNDRVYIGHNRLTIVDDNPRSNQPLICEDRRYYLTFNGEIYNYKDLINTYNLSVKTNSDTEVIMLLYKLFGPECIKLFDGMFSLVIYDSFTDEIFSARDRFGIKPLYFYENSGITIFGSEPGIIASILNLSVDQDSIQEWKLLRRPIPGYSFYKGLHEFPKASIKLNSSDPEIFYDHKKFAINNNFDQKQFEKLIRKSVVNHEMGDFKSVGLISGGVDSSLICLFSQSTKNFYSVGTDLVNEFDDAEKTTKHLKKELIKVQVSFEEIKSAWSHLIKIKKEPLSVPNEGLIYLLCKQMKNDEKVLLTGEGADELFFGYDRIFRYFSKNAFCKKTFLDFYSYSKNILSTKRFDDYFDNLIFNNKGINIVKEFFLDFHLPGLLRRMDFSAMAASKEARVPFLSNEVFEYVYNIPSIIKIDDVNTKKPLRNILNNSGLNFVNARKKIGFSANHSFKSRIDEYDFFQNFNMESLNW